MFQWVYHVEGGLLLHGGPCEVEYDKDTQGVVTLLRNPDPRTERYDGVGGTRLATAEELADYDTARHMEDTQARFDSEKIVKALAIWTAGKLNVPLATARQEILTILRGL